MAIAREEVKGTQAEYLEMDTGFLVNPDTGEIVKIPDAPSAEEMSPAEIIEWLGERKARLEGKLAALVAERQTWLDRIEEQYGSRVRTIERALEFLPAQYYDTLRQYAKEKLNGGKTKTYKEGLLSLSFRASRESVEIVDEDMAVAYLDDVAPEAVERRPTVKKSLIPDGIKPGLRPETTGLLFHPKGESETFEIK